MKPRIFAIFIVVLFAACETGGKDGQATGSPGDAAREPGVELTGPNSSFLVKLTSSMSAETSEPGDPVTAVVINPVPLRGGRVDGTVRRSDRAFINFSFHTLEFEGKRYPIESEITSVVSSKGNLGHDELGQRIRVAGGGIVAYGTTTAIDEGAEVRFVAWEKRE
jgi:hypothetical protein